jgi:hypothetical protein
MTNTVTVNGELNALSNNFYRENLSGVSDGFTKYGIGSDTLYMGNYRYLSIKPYEISSTFYQGVTKAHFLDGDLILAPTTGETLVFALYEKAFGRAADTAGLAYWAAQVNTGTPLQAVGRAFEASPEFAFKYSPSLNNEQFVRAVFGGSVDQASVDVNVARLEGGLTRGEVAGILTAATAYPAAIFVPKGTAGAVEQIYDTFFGRLPDKAGLAYWIHTADAGTPLQTIADGFAQSPEFSSKYSGTTDSAYVQTLYQNTLHRDADVSGFNYWTGQLEQGHSRAEVALGFAMSLEHAALVRSHVDHGLDFL